MSPTSSPIDIAHLCSKRIYGASPPRSPLAATRSLCCSIDGKSTSFYPQKGVSRLCCSLMNCIGDRIQQCRHQAAPLHRRMLLALRATRRTLHGASRLMLRVAMSAWSMETRRALSRHCWDARTSENTTMLGLSTPHFPPLPRMGRSPAFSSVVIRLGPSMA